MIGGWVWQNKGDFSQRSPANVLAEQLRVRQDLTLGARCGDLVLGWTIALVGAGDCCGSV